MMEQGHFKTSPENERTSGRKIFPVVDDLLDWLIDSSPGLEMSDSIPVCQNMKRVHPVRRALGSAPDRTWLIIRTNGTLAPCFPMYNATYDWGTVGNQKFDVQQLSEMRGLRAGIAFQH